jgi:hypothetical protein
LPHSAAAEVVLIRRAPVKGGVVRGSDGSAQVDLDNGVEAVGVELVEHHVADDAGVVDEDVELPVAVNGGRDELTGGVPVADVMRGGHRLAALARDLRYDVVRRRLACSRPSYAHAEVVDHHGVASFGERERVRAADPPAGPRDDCYLAVH